MAKTIEITPLKKGKGEFTLIGEAKINDFTFKLDVESSREDSDWVYNKLDLKVNCGSFYGDIDAGMMGGYGSARDNVVYVHGKKEDDNGKKKDDFENMFTIDWESRFDEAVLEDIGDMCFITVGLEKDDKDKTVYKKFLTEYDAIKYINDNLEEGMVINVKGNLVYNTYKNNLEREIRSIVLSKVKPEDYKATFVLSILLDKASIGKPNKETTNNTIPISGYVVEHTSKYDDKTIYKIVNGRRKNGTLLPFMKEFEFKIGDDLEKTKKMLKVFKVKDKKSLDQLTVDGYFTKGEIETVEINEKDIPDDIKELIEMGYIEESEIMDKIALANGGGKKPIKMFIEKPHIKFTQGEKKLPMIDRVEKMYTENDVDIDLILENFELEGTDTEEDKKDNEELSEDELLEQALNNEDESEEDDDDDWLNEI